MKSACCDYQVQWSYNEIVYEGCCLMKLKPHYVCGHCLREVAVDLHELWYDSDGNLIGGS